MEIFSYKAIDRSGKEIKGTLKARDERDLAARLRSMGYYPSSASRAARTEKESKGRSFLRRRAGGSRRVASFTHQLASMLEAGIPLDKSLALLAELEEDSPFKSVISDVLKGVRGGRPLADCLERKEEFPAFYVNTVRAGEAGGTLEDCLKRLGAYLEETEKLKDEIRSALVYPLLLTTFGGGAVVFMLIFVVPRFALLFEDLGGAAPLPALALIAAGRFFSSWFWILPLAIVLAWLGFERFRARAEGRLRLDSLKLSLPVLGPILRKAAAARFSRTLGTLLKSGVPIMEALGLSIRSTGNLALEKDLAPVLEGVSKGRGVAAPVAETGSFPRLASHMLAVGEETGRLDEMLLKLASDFEHEIRTSVKRAVSTLEPAIILVMALVVGSIVISMLLAVFSLNDIPL
ncbi:MAG: type II secretion system F family protein [Deltaproteobacteria bacterium]|nr:type II secretion system F family protein [Deltaproteobacteria bacterium]MBZ0219839.1 type II secretion system F family protein [Deltaproteobacteria bacterium]